MATLTRQQLYQYAYNAGFQGAAADEVVAIALAESGGDTQHVNVNGASNSGGISVPAGTRDRGVLQINDWWNNGQPGHGPLVTDSQAFDPAYSFQWAYNVTQGGKPNLFNAYWTTVKNGRYLQFLQHNNGGSSTGGSNTTSNAGSSPANAWFNFPFTQAHGKNGEAGVDIGTPDKTPITALYGGKVVISDFQPWGGEVFLAIPGTNYSEGFLHLTELDVQPGQVVQPGQQIGLSGGGVGDNLLLNGKVQPAKSQADWQGYSSGNHLEYDLFAGQSLAEINMDWHNSSRQADPTPALLAAEGKGSGGSIPLPTGGSIPLPIQGATLSSPTGATGSAVDTAFFNWLFSQLFGSQGLPNHFAARLLLGALGGTCIVLGLIDIVLSLQGEDLDLATLAKVIAL